MRRDINKAIFMIIDNLKSFNLDPKYCRIPNDPRIDDYIISINNEYYICIYGICDEYDEIIISKRIIITDVDISTNEGLELFATDNDVNLEISNNSENIFELSDLDDITNEETIINSVTKFISNITF